MDAIFSITIQHFFNGMPPINGQRLQFFSYSHMPIKRLKKAIG